MTGAEPLIAAAIASAVSGVAVPVFQTLLEGGGKTLTRLGKALDEKKLKQTIDTASKEYVQNYTKRHGILKVLGMREPVQLESVYTSVQFLDDSAIRSFESVETLEEVYRKAPRRSFQPKNCKKQDGLNVANDKQYLMVLGGPGAGKSTFLRRMGLEALKGKRSGFKHACIPVFIELKKFNTGEINIEHEIAEEFRICGFPSHEAFTAKALEQGKLLILLDGLDEVPTQRLNEAIGQIQNFVDLHDQNRFITSVSGCGLSPQFSPLYRCGNGGF
jgi:predicted NACHT family NTPase